MMQSWQDKDLIYSSTHWLGSYQLICTRWSVRHGKCSNEPWHPAPRPFLHTHCALQQWVAGNTGKCPAPETRPSSHTGGPWSLGQSSSLTGKQQYKTGSQCRHWPQTKQKWWRTGENYSLINTHPMGPLRAQGREAMNGRVTLTPRHCRRVWKTGGHWASVDCAQLWKDNCHMEYSKWSILLTIFD